VFGEIARSDRVRIALAAILYVVGAAWIIYVAVREDSVPSSVVNYWPLLVCGMILVVVAALLLPVPRSSEAPNGGDRDEEEDAESGV
jgi:fatty acid desaturase